MATVNYTVTVSTGTPHPDSGNVNPTGNVYFINGSEPTSLNITRGDTIRFDLSDPSNSGHDLRIADSTDVYTDIYTPGFYVNGEAGTPGAYVEWVVPNDVADDVYVFCYQHGLTMGFDLALSGTDGVAGTLSFTVTVDTGVLYNGGGTSGNVFLFNGQRYLDFPVTRGQRYVFDQTDASNVGHDFDVFYERIEGSDDYNVKWTAGITNNGGTAGVDRIVKFQAPSNTPSSLLYTCQAHGAGMGGIATVTGSNGTYVSNPETSDANSADLQNPTIDNVTFAQQYYDGALRYNSDLGRYEFFNSDAGWIQSTYAPTVDNYEGTFLSGELNSIVINGGGFDPQMNVQIVNINDIYTPLNNPITYTYISPTRAALTIDTRAPYVLQDGTGAIIEAVRFKLTSGVTGAAGVSGEVELDRDPEFGVAPLTTIGNFFVNQDNTFVPVDVENPVVLSALDPDDEDAVITFEVAPNTMGFGTNRNLVSDGGAVGTDPNPQNSDFSVYFEYQEPNQGILKGAVNPWSNGGPGHPDYGTNLGSSVRFPGRLDATHDLTVRAVSTAPDGRVTEKDETFRMRVVQPWKYISNISHHYVMGGYIGAESWRVVHKCDASTDTTVSLGIKLASNGVTTPNANRSGARYSSETVDRWSGQAMILGANRFGNVAGDANDQATENWNMITETSYGVTTSIMSTKRYDCQGFSYDTARKGYATGGYHAENGMSQSIDKINLATTTRESIINTTGYSNSYGGASVFGEVFGTMHQAGRSSQTPDGGFYFTFATDTPYGGNFQDLVSLGYTGAVGKALTTWQDRNYWIGYNVVDTCWYGDQSTTTYGVAPFVQTLNNGEGNCTGGLAHGYSLGGYNNPQNNHADRFNYASETCVRVSNADTTGNAGTSSAAVGWVEL